MAVVQCIARSARKCEASLSEMRSRTRWRLKLRRRGSRRIYMVTVEGAGTLAIVVGDERSVLNHIPADYGARAGRARGLVNELAGARS